MPNQQNIKLRYIVADPDLQPRAGIYPDAIEDYASDMRRGDQFPPLTVFYDGKTYWLALATFGVGPSPDLTRRRSCGLRRIASRSRSRPQRG
jgi:hypothetical protein